MAVITKTNVTELVQIYYELRQKKTDSVKENARKCMKCMAVSCQ